MDSSSFTGLLNNTAIMLALGVIYDALGLHNIHDRRKRQLISGLLIGTLGIAIMYTPWELMPGVFFDTRWVLISLSALFFGFAPTLIAVIMTVSFRLYQGGAGAYVGSLVIIIPAFIGLAWRYASRYFNQPLDIVRLYLFGVVIQLSVLTCFLLLPEIIRDRTIMAVGPPMLIIFPVGTMLLGLILRRQHDRRIAERELKRSQEQLDKERSLLRGLIDALPDLIFFKDTNERFLGCNQAFEKYIGCSEAELINKTEKEVSESINKNLPGRENHDLADEDNKIHYEEEVIYPDGSQVIFHSVKAKFYGINGHLHGTVGICHDITELKQAEEKIRELAFYDPLTQLPNRRLLLDRLKMMIARCQRSRRYSALLFIDLDHFKDINDTQGHSLGDELLKAVASRIQGKLRKIDTAARLGGDEFVVIIGEISSDKVVTARVAEEIAEKLRSELSKPYKLNNPIERIIREPIQHYCSASIGISLFPEGSEEENEVLRQADMAMYQSKASGRNTIRFFDPEMQLVRDEHLALQVDLRKALASGELELYYQVQVDSITGIKGAEALLRWNHPTRGLIFPDYFISLAEETGLIIPIGQWILTTACHQLKRWQESPQFREMQISINVSARQFRQPSFADEVREIILNAGIDPAKIKLELTESLMLDDIEGTIEKMLQLNNFGVTFSMDDFGTGHSSLSNLRRLPLEQIKIDRSFIRDLTTDTDDAVIIKAIINLSTSLNLEVIAEGVETEAQCQFLYENGCNQYQGYLFSRPIPILQFEALVTCDKKLFKVYRRPGLSSVEKH